MVMEIYVFLGPPGAGKGTQAKLFCASNSMVHISTGDMLRAAMKAGTELGNKVKGIVDSGNLVSDDIMIDLIRERIEMPDCENGFVLDGFPRTLNQAKSLDLLFKQKGISLTATILFEISADALFFRLEERRSTENRADDTAETQLERLRVYEESTAPLIEYYESLSLLKRVDANSSVEEVSNRVSALVQILRER
jgi:adenylate kinase